MQLIEIILSIHCLLLASSWFIGGRRLANQPSFKLKLARLLLVSCVVSPLLVQCIGSSQKPARLNIVSLDNLQGLMSQPVLKAQTVTVEQEPGTAYPLHNMSYYQLFGVIFCFIVMYRSYRFLSALSGLRAFLAEAIPYRSSGKLMIKVSDRCHIPFSVYLFRKAYIVLPVSLLSSARNVRIAMAHEGQHHRNGDCLWAYLIEILGVIFFGNPGVTRWRNILSELQEFSCDEVLVGHPQISTHDYGQCLFQVVRTLSLGSLPSNQEFACTVGMASNKENEDCTFIIRRISMLSTYPYTASRSLLLGVACAGFSILAPICAAYAAAGTLASAKARAVDTTHLHPEIQKIAAKEIAAAVKHYHAKSGVVAIADPATGKIIAFAESTPKGQDSWKTRVFSPGSTIKPFIAAAAIDSGNSSETQSYDCHSPYSVNGKSFTNFSADVGSASLTEAIAKSINVCLIKVSQETGAPIIRKKLTEFGFDMDSWWQANQSQDEQLARASLGENIPVTMESLTTSYAILANKGRSFAQGNTPVISKTTINSINRMLEEAVTHGTGRLAAIPGVSVAGKTGTVLENKQNHLALFAGYMPVEKPRYVMVVVIEQGHLNKEGKLLSSGGELAAPVFHHIAMSSLSGGHQ
ncbi:penicillin-binding transpeptidase domain-containing protein [Fluoribacter dumoffii]|uniref:Penicillin-binding protein 2 n=1 Tax=Fluoribacter dumoffii TaxID=463 RepID=A0A377G6H7_9GAMM|nr:M56 family metallopeptidase [Fluoribacter dumoffii]KTC89318.1 cell division protein FtsI/penicillin-binding protein 2 [Fluoribacter dumoffii NY 23]MCW8386923.1 penicillin-binding transpeptidase domain-containing protein [Fluoribacter dumoffii]MCW8497125.1 penicillin-binding transpeptidase domain-containing protein [Fluoribacter dumoffii]STO20427.1 Penicillin-binding protein 2 [Fluoribacter dumoffii]